MKFEVADAMSYRPADGRYDLIAFFDWLHDMVDPIGAPGHARASLAPGRSIMLVEPMAGEHVEDNLNPVGRVYAGAFVLVSTPNSLAGGGIALGTLASEARLRDVAAAPDSRRSGAWPRRRSIAVRCGDGLERRHRRAAGQTCELGWAGATRHPSSVVASSVLLSRHAHACAARNSRPAG